MSLESMPLTSIEKSLLVAAYFRGGSVNDEPWFANTDQILTLSLFYTGEISWSKCVQRFSVKRYLGGVYDEKGELDEQIKSRHQTLIRLLRFRPDLMEYSHEFEAPTYPTYTSCRLTSVGETLATSLIPTMPQKPNFPNWPDKRPNPRPD